jgi:RND superfamily putative drug exporter
MAASIAAVGGLLGDALTGDSHVTNRPESERAYELLHDRAPGSRDPDDYLMLSSRSLTVDDRAFALRARELEREARARGIEARAETYFESGDEGLVSPDRHTALFPIFYEGRFDHSAEQLGALAESADGGGFAIDVTGNESADRDFEQLVEDDLASGELQFGLPAAVVILTLVLGSVVAALVTFGLASLAILLALALTALLGQQWQLSDFVVNIVVGMGLALGIDYGLFIISRYREERGHGREPLGAIDAAGATASRAVLFSGTAFAVALLGMVLVPQTDLRSIGAGATIAGLASMAVALTLMPAVLALTGDRVNAVRVPFFGARVARHAGQEGAFWGRAVRAVMRHPVVSVIASVALLLAAAAPVTSLRYGESGVSLLPERFPSRQGYEVLERQFARGTGDPVVVVVDGDPMDPRVRAAVRELSAELDRSPPLGRTETLELRRANLAVITVPISGDAHGQEAVDTVERIRAEAVPRGFDNVPARALVTGESAESADYFALMDDWLPRVIAFVLALTFVLLLIAFRSIVVPLKAIVLNLLSVTAAYGLLVLVFQEGVATSLFGFQQIEALEAWLPLFLFSVLFGLSMDYHVFLLSRIREAYDRTGDNEQAVVHGVSSTARLITGAALIIIAVYVGFARGELVFFQQLGFGVAVALLIDATLVRLVLLPATMRLLGRWNWYLPRWLEWLPRLGGERA